MQIEVSRRLLEDDTASEVARRIGTGHWLTDGIPFAAASTTLCEILADFMQN